MNKPILFNTQMTVAVDDGTKSETRRIVKYDFDHLYAASCAHGKWYETFGVSLETAPDSLIEWYVREIAKPPCAPGDVLWVRETWAERVGGYTHKANSMPTYPHAFVDRWHPSIHMPKEAARLFLLVKDVWVERLQDVTPEQAQAEGAIPNEWDSANEAYGYVKSKYVRAFNALWNTTIKPADLPRYGWDANPWVWVVEFERCDKPDGWEAAP